MPTRIGLAVLTSALVVGSLVLSSCATLKVAADGGVSSTTAPLVDEVVATTNLDGRTRIPAGSRIDIAAKFPWAVEWVDGIQRDRPAETGPTLAESWRSTPLPPGQRLAITATLRNQVTDETYSLTRTALVGKAEHTFTANLFPSHGTYGVGVIPTVTFSRPIPRAQRASIVERLAVSAQPQPVEGGWRWLDDSTVAFRPAQFWPARTAVTVSADLDGARIGRPDPAAAWGKTTRASWRTGRSMVVRIDASRYRGTVTIDDRVKLRFPVSLGKPGFITRSGVKTLTDKYRMLRMTNLGITDDAVWDLQVPYSMRITNSGEFLHAAPWNGRIGYAHTSHGCTNLRTEDARFIFERMLWGDPVITKGTGRPMEIDNGPGARWNIPADQWSNS